MLVVFIMEVLVVFIMEVLVVFVVIVVSEGLIVVLLEEFSVMLIVESIDGESMVLFGVVFSIGDASLLAEMET